MKREWSVLFAGKKNDEHTLRALEFCKRNFSEVRCYLGEWGDPWPSEIDSWRGDLLISYLSRWVFPDAALKNAKVAAINFHPAPPEYPGIGCNNLALYEEASEYGVTCHHMAPKVDTGAIIGVKRFPVFDTDDVASLLARTYDYQLILFYEVLSQVLSGKDLPTSDEQWKRAPITRREFQNIAKITLEMPMAEVAKRIRATKFGDWKPTIEFQGFTFELKTN